MLPELPRGFSPVLPQDVTTLARALFAVRAESRPDLCRHLFDAAERAAAHLQRSSRLHPRWGNGTLDAAARTVLLEDEPQWSDPEFIDCLLLVLAELKTRIGSVSAKKYHENS